MSFPPRLITRIALFSALIYVLSWGTTLLPNVNLAFFVAFSAGYLWGIAPGLMVGAVGMWLWSSFNPYGPVSLPVMLAQVAGMAACGLIGGISQNWSCDCKSLRGRLWLLMAAFVCTMLFYLPVSFVDAWVYQPFWPRFVTGMIWSLISLVANLLIFPLLFGVTRHLYDRERDMRCSN
ncbi:MAG: hypothetical protein DRP45_07795 [Candidatus Zixiibacteriota bacterium]|nr:MAG: hypothetical protein DRP45_07795 [candidate division Zixibacteria bacterium]